MSRKATLRAVCLIFAVVTLGIAGVSFAGEPASQGSLCAEIHEAVSAAGMKCASVRCTAGRYEVILDPSCAGQQAQADRIRDQVVVRGPIVIVVDNLQDALVVLRFEPSNESANRLVRERYQKLKTAARSR